MFSEFQHILNQGGPILWALILLGIGLYTIQASTWLELRKIKSELSGQKFTGEGRRGLIRQFAAFELDRIAWVDRRLPLIGVLAGIAPLAGLLGTVSGMLVAFAGLATSSVAQPIDKISAGISEALITTQAGLLIAIPAMFLLALLCNQTQSTHAKLQQRLHEALISSSSNRQTNLRASL